MDTAVVERRIAQKEARKFKGTTVYHSDIVKHRGGSQSVISSRLLGVDRSEDVDGGRAAVLTETTSYKMYILYMAPNCSTGMKKVTAGSKTVMVNSGRLFASSKSKKEEFSKTFSPGQIINLEKGSEYALSSGNYEVECLIIEGADLKQKSISDPISNLSGLEQHIALRVPAKKPTSKKPRKRKTKDEREALGRKYKLAQGVKTEPEKAQISNDIVRGKSTDASQTVVGVNPTPIGNIGDDYM